MHKVTYINNKAKNNNLKNAKRLTTKSPLSLVLRYLSTGMNAERKLMGILVQDTRSLVLQKKQWPLLMAMTNQVIKVHIVCKY